MSCWTTNSWINARTMWTDHTGVPSSFVGQSSRCHFESPLGAQIADMLVSALLVVAHGQLVVLGALAEDPHELDEAEACDGGVNGVNAKTTMRRAARLCTRTNITPPSRQRRSHAHRRWGSLKPRKSTAAAASTRPIHSSVFRQRAPGRSRSVIGRMPDPDARQEPMPLVADERPPARQANPERKPNSITLVVEVRRASWVSPRSLFKTWKAAMARRQVRTLHEGAVRNTAGLSNVVHVQRRAC